jgi:hypothetical protein
MCVVHNTSQQHVSKAPDLSDLVLCCAGDPTADIATGLAALVNRVTSRPDTCWRVGVGYVTAEDQAKAQGEAAAAAAAAAEKRILLRQATHKSKAKPAVMVVSRMAGIACDASSSALVHQHAP